MITLPGSCPERLDALFSKLEQPRVGFTPLDLRPAAGKLQAPPYVGNKKDDSCGDVCEVVGIE